MRMDVQDNPDIEFPVVIVSISQPGAAPTEIENQITQRVEAAVRTLNGVADISSTASEGNSTRPSSSSRSAPTSTRRSTRSRTRSTRSAASLPDGILEPQVVQEADHARQPIAYFAVERRRHDDRAAELVHRRYRRQAAAVDRGHGRGRPQRRRRPRDPRRCSIRRGCSRSASPRAQVNNALRQLNINAAGGQRRNRRLAPVGARARQCRRPPTSCRRPQIALGGGRTVKLADIADGQRRLSASSSSHRPRSTASRSSTFGISRAKGASDVTVYDEAIEELDEDREGKSRASTSPSCSPASTTPRPSTTARWRR